MKRCIHCGKEISSRKKFCDKKCSDNYYYNNNIVDKVCPTCKKTFRSTKNKVFCSVECSSRNRTKLMKLCPVCKRRFRGTRLQIYCSSKCSKIVNANKKGIKASKCIVCGALYKKYDKNNLKTCSPECGSKLVEHTKNFILMRAFITEDISFIKNKYFK